jgi:response regulator of citrate/malate metabolism
MWAQQVSALVSMPTPSVVAKYSTPKPYTKEAKETVLEQQQKVRDFLNSVPGKTATTKQVADAIGVCVESARTRLRWLKSNKEVEVLARNSKFQSAIWRLK